MIIQHDDFYSTFCHRDGKGDAMKFLVLLISCSLVAGQAHDLAKAVSLEAAKELYETKDLYPLEVKRWVKKGVQKVGLKLQCFQIASVEDARKLAVSATRIYLAKINQKKNLRPYLIHYPFTTKDIRLELVFIKSSLDPIPVGAINSVLIENGKIVYFQKLGEGYQKECLTESFQTAEGLL